MENHGTVKKGRNTTLFSVVRFGPPCTLPNLLAIKENMFSSNNLLVLFPAEAEKAEGA
jgi:hypothetical protein